GVLALFNKEIVKKDLIEKELGRFYSEMFDRRQKGDYEDFVKFNKEDVKVWLEKAEEFINKVEELTFKIIKEYE
ncbi:MAG: HEPN domain-containing protein, partial [bacterium]